MSGDVIKSVQVCIKGLFRFLWRDVSDGAVQTFGVVPVHPFQGFPFDPADGFPWAEASRSEYLMVWYWADSIEMRQDWIECCILATQNGGK